MTNNWRQYARCLGADPELFYPTTDEAAEEARAICTVCPVREPCLEYAITAREKQGVWGGLTERERRALLRQRPNVTSWRGLLETAKAEHEMSNTEVTA